MLQMLAVIRFFLNFIQNKIMHVACSSVHHYKNLNGILRKNECRWYHLAIPNMNRTLIGALFGGPNTLNIQTHDSNHYRKNHSAIAKL